MHTLSTRIPTSLASDRGEDFDPGEPPSPVLLELLSLAEHAGPVIGEPGSYERRRERERERERRAARNAVPAWFAAEDLTPPPWETRRAHLA